jgi:hypothetical protein
MRSPLATVAVGLLLIAGSAGASAPGGGANEDAVAPGLVAERYRTELYGAELSTDRVLPVQGQELPVEGTSLTGSGSRAYTLDPQVQAIPTPTAVDFGLVALIGLISARLLLSRRRPERSDAAA